MAGSLRACVIGRGVGLEHIKGYEAAGVPVVAHYDRMRLDEIRAGDYEILSIASPDQCHVDQAIAALRQGIHVFCEKPASHSVWDLRRLRWAVRRSAASFWLNLPLNQLPVFYELAMVMRQQRPYFVEGSYNWGRQQKMLSGWRAECKPYSFMAAGGLHIMAVVALGLAGQDESLPWRKRSFWRTDRMETASWEVNGVPVQITANFGYDGPHEQIIKAWLPSGCVEVRNKLEVCKWAAIPELVNMLRRGESWAGAYPLYLNRIALG
jgi:hypothetical protein